MASDGLQPSDGLQLVFRSTELRDNVQPRHIGEIFQSVIQHGISVTAFFANKIVNTRFVHFLGGFSILCLHRSNCIPEMQLNKLKQCHEDQYLQQQDIALPKSLIETPETR